MAVVGAPVVCGVLCLGCGLALERVLSVRLTNALLLPLGLCVAMALIFPGYALGAGATRSPSRCSLARRAGRARVAQEGLRARLNPGWPGSRAWPCTSSTCCP